MPEGDTLFRIASTLRRALAGKEVVRFETAVAQLAMRDRAEPIAGRVIERVESRGKHLLIGFSGGLTLRTHLRMNGAWHIYRPGERWQRASSRARVVVGVADFVAVGFDLPVADLLTGRELARDPSLSSQGPDLLDDGFDLPESLRRLRARGGNIGDALLDQRVIAGIGNIFRCEALFAAGVHPSTSIAALGPRLDEVVACARKLLGASARSTRGPRWVYDRAGLPCRRCGTPIAHGRTGENVRSLWWCPRCQTAPGSEPMCTLALQFHPGAELPLLLAANRDEALDRPASGPALRDGPIPYLAPRDERAGGTWLGLNARGLFVGITNRYGQPPDPARRSRGQLVVDALGFGSAAELHRFMASLEARRYNPFHLLYVDAQFAGATWTDGESLRQEALRPGLHVVTERSFAAVPTVEREARLRAAWALADVHAPAELEKLRSALVIHDPETRIGGTCVHAEALNYGTRSSLLLALPRDLHSGRLLWAEGHPCENAHLDRSDLLRELWP